MITLNLRCGFRSFALVSRHSFQVPLDLLSIIDRIVYTTRRICHAHLDRWLKPEEVSIPLLLVCQAAKGRNARSCPLGLHPPHASWHKCAASRCIHHATTIKKACDARSRKTLNDPPLPAGGSFPPRNRFIHPKTEWLTLG